MLELYAFLASLLLLTLLLGRRHWIIERFKKLDFRKKVAAQVEEIKKEAQGAQGPRFRESLGEEQRQKKWDIVKYKNCMRQAEMALAKKNWKKAEALLIQALAEAKEEAPASLKLAGLYLITGEERKTETLLLRLAELTPQDPVVFASLARIYTQKKRYKEAIGAYVRAVELNPKKDEWLVHLGQLYQLLMRPGLAAECFRRAAEMKPRETATLFLLAEACREDEDFDNALFTYEKILMIEPYNEKAQACLLEMRTKRQETEVIIQKITHKQNLSVSQ